MAKQAQDVKYAAKEKDWNNFIQGINHRTPLPEIVKKVNIISGKKTKEPRHPDATGKANELIDKWASASSHDELPLHVRSALRKRLKDRQAVIQTALQATGPPDHIPFTESELRIAPSPGNPPLLDSMALHMKSLTSWHHYGEIPYCIYITSYGPPRRSRHTGNMPSLFLYLNQARTVK